MTATLSAVGSVSASRSVRSGRFYCITLQHKYSIFQKHSRRMRYNYFTAVLELGDMFDGGRVLIDHYIIQVDNGTQLETPGPTYSFDIMYKTTLSVNISAHNCAGYSDPFPVMIVYDPGET